MFFCFSNFYRLSYLFLVVENHKSTKSVLCTLNDKSKDLMYIKSIDIQIYIKSIDLHIYRFDVHNTLFDVTCKFYVHQELAVHQFRAFVALVYTTPCTFHDQPAM